MNQNIGHIVNLYEKFLGSVKPDNTWGGITWDKGLYLDLMDAIARRVPLVSRKTISSHITGFKSKIPIEEQIEQDLTVTKSQIEDLLQELDKLVRDIVVYVPLSGVSLERLTSKELLLGEYKIYQFGEGPLQEVWGNLAKSYENADSYVAIGGVKGDAHFAIEQAYQLAESVVYILNLYAMPIEARLSRSWRIELAVTQSYKSEMVIWQPVVQDDEKPNLNQLGGYSHSLKDFSSIDITPDMVEDWKKLGLEKVIRCFEDSQNEIQKRIKRSIIWYSRGMNADDPNEQFVDFAIALENLLVGDEGNSRQSSWGSITQKLADRVAFLLAEKYEDRVKESCKAKDLYGLRSKVVHTGQPVTEQQLIEICQMTRRVILAFVAKPFASWKDFIDWITRLIYSSGTSSTTSL